MRTRRIFILFFSILILPLLGQKQDSVKVKYQYKPNFMVGADVLNAGIGFFSDRKLFQGFVSSEVRKDIHAYASAGYERNLYQKNGYDVSARGPFVKIGGFYMLAKDPENKYNGFYGGMNLAAAFYRQEYRAVPVRGYQGGDAWLSFPPSSQSSYWAEANVGGRVQLFGSPFYIDVNMQPKYLLYSVKQESIKPMIVPGFGKSSTKVNFGFSWNIAYFF